MSAYTDGPWHYTHKPNAKRARGLFLTVYPVGDSVPVCDVNRHRGPASEANARLIAAAPDLLSALKAAQSALNQIPRARLTGEYSDSYKVAAVVDAAISKAEVES